MTKRALAVSCAAMMAGTPAAAAPWTRGYVVGYYNYAFHFGGRGSYTEPGVDCPHGSTTFFDTPDSITNTLSLVPWRTKKEIEAVANPAPAAQGQAQAGAGRSTNALAQYRGYKPDIQTYVNPFAAEDPGELEVVSRIGEGFNLDGKIKPNDFVSPDGEKGIDNALYRAWGCTTPWRSDDATMVLRSNDKMTQGMYTIVVRLSGNKDPMNDDQATLEIGFSPDKVMKDGRGNIAAGYSFRIPKSEMYSKLQARIKNGVVETEQASIHMPEMAWWPNQVRDANFRQGKIRLIVNADGTASGLVGGYRDWRDLYAQETYSQDGAQQGIREREDHVALYYALRRNADGMFNAKTGRYDAISSVYRMKLAPAFVVDADAPTTPTFGPIELLQIAGYNEDRLAMIKATDTLIPQEPPPPNGAPGRFGEGRRPNRQTNGAKTPSPADQ